MVDRIAKALDRFTPKEKENIAQLLLRIRGNDMKGLDVRKLKGRDDVYRARKGKMRIIYRIHSGIIFVLAIEKRTDHTYRDF